MRLHVLLERDDSFEVISYIFMLLVPEQLRLGYSPKLLEINRYL